MKFLKLILCNIILFLCVFGCKKPLETATVVTNTEDYNQFLSTKENERLRAAQEDYLFWKKKLEKTPNQFPYLVKAAASQSLLFGMTGKIEHLINAEKHLLQANKATNYGNSGYLRALPRNYISQHKFKDALSLLKKAELNGDRLKATQKMLFDVSLELGNIAEAKTYLSKIENYKDFDFLIRKSKWSDYKGDLDNAILYLEKATEMAETRNNKGLTQWAYTNLADYYGHAGKIQASYNHYLKALEINPNDAYAKKGIAWIIYSHEKKPEEALRILNTTTLAYKAPDYHLLKAEIAEFKGDLALKDKEIRHYQKAVSNSYYGDMYNKYTALLLTEDKITSSKALKIAKEEVNNRPTAQSYDLLAWAHYGLGEVEVALDIIEKNVVGKTFEPEALFHMAEIYKANGKKNEAELLKQELLNSTFELGPLTVKKIKNI